MLDFGGYLPALRRRKLDSGAPKNYYVLIVDVGAFTTDFAYLEYDLDEEEKAPTMIWSTSCQN